MVPTWNNVVPAWNYKVPSWNYIVPTWNHMVPIKPVNLHFLILKYLRIGFSKKRFHIQHHKNMLIVSSTLKSWKIPTFFFEVEPYSSKLELQGESKKTGISKFSNCYNSLIFEAKIHCNTIKPNVPKWRKNMHRIKIENLIWCILMALRWNLIFLRSQFFFTHPVYALAPAASSKRV